MSNKTPHEQYLEIETKLEEKGYYFEYDGGVPEINVFFNEKLIAVIEGDNWMRDVYHAVLKHMLGG